MLRITKSGKETLDKEVERYRDYVIQRAETYASQDDSIAVNDKHVIRAAKDFQNDIFFDGLKKASRESRRNQTYVMLFLTLFCLLLFVFITVVELYDKTKGIASHTTFISSFIGAITASLMVISTTELTSKLKKTRGRNDVHRMIISFLNKWNETESLLSNLYKKKHHKEAGTIKDLLLFYKEIPLVKERAKEDAIHSMLNARNNFIHRSKGEVREETIIGLNKEMDEIIEILKVSN